MVLFQSLNIESKTSTL